MTWLAARRIGPSACCRKTMHRKASTSPHSVQVSRVFSQYSGETRSDHGWPLATVSSRSSGLGLHEDIAHSSDCHRSGFNARVPGIGSTSEWRATRRPLESNHGSPSAKRAPPGVRSSRHGEEVRGCGLAALSCSQERPGTDLGEHSVHDDVLPNVRCCWAQLLPLCRRHGAARSLRDGHGISPASFHRGRRHSTEAQSRPCTTRSKVVVITWCI